MNSGEQGLQVNLHQLLRAMIEKGASDMHITTGSPPLLRIDGATINFYVTHLAAWDRFNSSARRKQIDCVVRQLRGSSYPILLTGDFNASPRAAEVMAFERESPTQICGLNLPITNPMLRKRIDYVWADYGWEVLKTQVPRVGPSDHWPVVTELMWARKE